MLHDILLYVFIYLFFLDRTYWGLMLKSAAVISLVLDLDIKDDLQTLWVIRDEPVLEKAPKTRKSATSVQLQTFQLQDLLCFSASSSLSCSPVILVTVRWTRHKHNRTQNTNLSTYWVNVDES